MKIFYSHFENPQPGQVTQPPSCITELPQSGHVEIFLKVKSVTSLLCLVTSSVVAIVIGDFLLSSSSASVVPLMRVSGFSLR